MKTFALLFVTYILIFNILLYFKRKRSKRILEITFRLFAELESSFNPNEKFVLELLKNISNKDFKEIALIFSKKLNRDLINDLYEFLQPDNLNFLEKLVSRSRIEIAAKNYMFRNIANDVNDFFIFEDKDINTLIRHFNKLPDHDFDGFNAVYFSMFNERLEDKHVLNYPEVRQVLKRLF